MPSEYRVLWDTPGGGTGYSVFHFGNVTSDVNAQGIANETLEFFLSIQNLFPDDITFTGDGEVRVLDLDGTLLSVFPVTPPTPVVGTGTAPYNRAAGLRIDWQTGQIVAGRRLTGRTYMVPCNSDAFDDTGLVQTSTRNFVNTQADAFRSEVTAYASMVVWSKTHATSGVVLANDVPLQGAILRGRRD